MKTRIISGVVMGAIVAAALTLGLLWNSAVIIVGMAVLCAVASYELLHNAVGIKEKITLIIACAYSFISLLFYPSLMLSVCCATVYFVLAVVMVLKNHKEFNISHIVSVCAMPIVLNFAFFSLTGVALASKNLYYLLLLLNFSSVCDIGAYFTGVTIGKHKLCPELSPKKTVEGAIGGIISSLIVSVILSICYKTNIAVLLIATVFLCVVGMMGDLFASSIKRAVGLKDYGNLIPGHGGILDRFDSILMIAPLIYLLYINGVI